MKAVTVILVNLGSPEAPEPRAVARFLRPFLGDRRVVEIPRLVWWPILNGIVIPRRAKRVAANYQAIWFDEGSPIRVYTERLAHSLEADYQEARGDHIAVRYAMTYGGPSIAEVLASEQRRGVERFVVIPLYPQYSATTTAPVYDQVGRYLTTQRNIPDIHIVKSYHDNVTYIQALADSVREHWQLHGQSERLLMSFHGIPERNIELGDPYQSHCEQTAAALAANLDLDSSQWALSYQSRFGRARWLQPYTDGLLERWGQAGVQNISVISPAFAVDCLETLEEIDGEYRRVFFGGGGKIFHYIPCLNDSEAHVRTLTSIVDQYI